MLNETKSLAEEGMHKNRIISWQHLYNLLNFCSYVSEINRLKTVEGIAHLLLLLEDSMEIWEYYFTEVDIEI